MYFQSNAVPAEFEALIARALISERITNEEAVALRQMHLPKCDQHQKPAAAFWGERIICEQCVAEGKILE